MPVALKLFTQNRLRINPVKTGMVLLRSRGMSVDPEFSIYFGSDIILPVYNVRVIRITIDSLLSWEEYLNVVVQRSYHVLVGVTRMRHKLPKGARRFLAETLVFPH